MRPPIGKIMPSSVEGDPVFQDLSGLRKRWVLRWGRAALFIVAAWLVAMAVMVALPARLPSDDIAQALAPSAPKVGTRATDASLLIEAKAGGSPYLAPDDTETVVSASCTYEEPAPGAAIAASSDAYPSRIYAIVPTQPENAFLPLLRHCAQIDVMLPEWFKIKGPSLSVAKNDIDAEMQQVVDSVRAKRQGTMQFWPVFNLDERLTSTEFLAGLGDKASGEKLAGQIVQSAVALKSGGLCLRLRDVKAKDSAVLMPFLLALRAQANRSGLETCLIASLSDQLWSSAEAVSQFDKVIVTAFQEPWIGSDPQPLAPLDWFRAQVSRIQTDVPPKKLVVALGGHAVDWVSGSAVPERISIAEAMFRISTAKATIDFSAAARNSYATFFDPDGRRHQMWMMDAASVLNSAKILRDLGIWEIAMPSLGEEEPSYWDVLGGQLPDHKRGAFAAPAFPDNVVYTGSGPFYRLKQPAQAGRRLWHLDPESGLITQVLFDRLPRPAEMEHYGARATKKIALTFDDGPNEVATPLILDALKAEGATATFFVVGKAVLSAPEVVKRALAEGNTIGSHSFSHPHLEELSPFHAKAELRLNRSLLEGVIGRSPLLYRPPYVRGPGPLDERGAMSFSVVQDEGYVISGIDIVPADWTGIGAKEIVRQTLDELNRYGGNVIVLHDGASEGMHTAEAVTILIPLLRANGYEIVSLAELLGSTPDAMMPRAAAVDHMFKGLSVSVISVGLAALVVIFWVCIFASVVRSLIYLQLSFRRAPVFPRSFAGPPSVTVVVPAYNEEKVIVQTVMSILACDYRGLNVLVIDDGSTDGTLGMLAGAFGKDSRVKVITQPNQGKWRALNTAFQRIETEIAVCVDADTRIDRDAITEIVKPFADRKVAAVAGTVVVANDNRLLTKFQSIEYITAQQIGRRAQEHLNGIMVVPGALGAWRVEAVRDVGFYSNETLTEDADLTIWLRRGGYRISYAENARSRTEAPADVRSLLKQRLRWSLGNLQTLWKHRGAFLEFGPARAFSMVDMVFFGFLLPLVSPVIDLLFLYFLFDLAVQWQAGELSKGIDMPSLAMFGMAMVQVMDIAVAWIAHRQERRPTLGLIVLVPLMNLLYRPLMYLTVYRALWSALSGKLARWNKLRRIGLDAKLGTGA